LNLPSESVDMLRAILDLNSTLRKCNEVPRKIIVAGVFNIQCRVPYDDGYSFVQKLPLWVLISYSWHAIIVILPLQFCSQLVPSKLVLELTNVRPNPIVNKQEYYFPLYTLPVNQFLNKSVSSDTPPNLTKGHNGLGHSFLLVPWSFT
jgi:hypothetical protein